MNNIANRIKEICTELKITQLQFANKLDLSHSAISQIISGKNKPSVKTIRNICRVFNVNHSWLETGKGEMFLKTEPPAAGDREGSPEHRRGVRYPEKQRCVDMLNTILDKGSDHMKKAIKLSLAALSQAVETETVHADHGALVAKIQTDIENRYKDKIADQEDRIQRMQKEFEALKAYVTSLSPDSKSQSPASGVRASQETSKLHKK